MTSEVIYNLVFVQPAGFTQNQFRKLDQLYCTSDTLSHRTVECDFDEGLASYTYYKSEGMAPYLQFVIRKVGPRTTMYEVYRQNKGRITKSSVFDRAYRILTDEIEKISL